MPGMPERQFDPDANQFAILSHVQPSFSPRWLALVAALLLALYLCWRLIQPFLDVLLWATVLVVVFRPVHRESTLGWAVRPGQPPARRSSSSSRFCCR